MAGGLVEAGDFGVAGGSIVDSKPEIVAGMAAAGNAGCWVDIEMSGVEGDGPVGSELSPAVEVQSKMKEVALGCHTEVGLLGYYEDEPCSDTRYTRALSHGSRATHLVLMLAGLDNLVAGD